MIMMRTNLVPAKCRYCAYSWLPRVAAPVSCPRCRRRLDLPPRKPKKAATLAQPGV